MRTWQRFFKKIKRKPLEIFPKFVYWLEVPSKHLWIELDIVHIATAGSLVAVDSLDPIFDDLFTPFGDNDRCFACNVDSAVF